MGRNDPPTTRRASGGNRLYGSKVSYHEYDDLVNVWKQNPGGGLRSIVNAGLGANSVRIMDYLGRNAFLQGSYKMYAGSASSFGNIGVNDKLGTGDIMDVHLGMFNRELPLAVSPVDGSGTIICITTPGVLHDLQLQQSDAWIDRLKYADPRRLLNYEVGTWMNVRFVITPRAHLFNCGKIYKQCAVVQPIQAGDGASEKVDDAWQPGQSTASHWVYLSDFDEGDFNVNDIVTLHVWRTNEFGVEGGVDYRDGVLHNLRVTGVDAQNNALQFAEVIGEDFTRDLTGTGVYGYVTKGRHIHMSLFLGGPDGVIKGIGREPRLHTPPRYDDFESMYRFSWDAYIGHNVVNPEQFEVFFSAGSFRFKGDRVTQ